MLCQVRLQVSSGGCAEVTLVTLVELQGVVIGQNVATELQRVDSLNYSKLLKRRFNLVKFQFLKDNLLWFYLVSDCKLVWI